MTAGWRVFTRLSSIEHKYGDVALAAAILCLAVGVHGAFAVASLHKHAGLTGAGDGGDPVALLEQHGTPVLFHDVDRPLLTTTERHELALAQITERPTTSTTSSTVATAHEQSSHILRRDTAAPQSPTAPSASVRSIVAKADTANQLDDSIDEPAISALATSESSEPAPLAISALLDEHTTVPSESTAAVQPTISAVAK